jgi:hypothetical protein
MKSQKNLPRPFSPQKVKPSTWLKKGLCLGLALLTFSPLHLSAEPWEADYTLLLQKYVRKDGVNYRAWHENTQDRQKLDTIIDSIRSRGPAQSDPQSMISYHINSYNAWVLKGVLDAYPINTVRDIAPLFGFFTSKRIEVAGKKMSLNHLEKELLLKQFKDPRIHFAVNCASFSCPPLLNQAYTAKELNLQLNQATREFLNQNPEALVFGNEPNQVKLSSLFDWYASDFKAAGGVIPFLNQYRTQPLNPKSKISYLKYNWNLNESR